jgi:zinc/manganese transport system permease protein
MTDLLIFAFVLSVVLLGIHSWYGMEIIRRGIIFTDLAIGQMAALGAAFSLKYFDGRFVYLISLSFALLAGLAIAMVSRNGKDPEAFIGLLYAFGISSIFILLTGSPHGMEEIDKLLAADILFTPRPEIIKTAVLYSILGIAIYFGNKKLSGNVREVFFFLTFALTVTSSVKLAGVLVVFALLVGPALIASHFKTRNKLVLAWGIGIIVNLVSIFISYSMDLPTGYTIVFCHSFAAILSYLIYLYLP